MTTGVRFCVYIPGHVYRLRGTGTGTDTSTDARVSYLLMDRVLFTARYIYGIIGKLLVTLHGWY